MEKKTPNAPSEKQADGERAAIRKAIDETEAPTRAEVAQAGKRPERTPNRPAASQRERSKLPPPAK